ncbi:MAG: hypothetical protein CFH28_01029 [Alphaproteobacteria bacterium MarineAlpha6_Bin6]|nr:MAG: hypothetical protein CFH28_01029 [Alphaproteobacteria bacterium MarineAlpha6_Bin6]PPR33990.1 MAG: hypothetical protein CFH27_00287 [Alphaproteobacteria bacterium MarineAlpha6_Bin5]|tara:strand:+ start:647 stop:1057 length:411 start_codon:yes stop_codon:yes gene_type:complete
MTKALILSSGIAFIIFLIIDFIWLSVAVKYLYKPSLGSLLLDKPIMLSAFAFYLLYIIGITFLVISPNLNGFQILKAFWMGGLFGLVAYGTYDLTNLATIKGWSLKVTIIDLFWGGILTAVVSSLTVWVMSKINPI